MHTGTKAFENKSKIAIFSFTEAGSRQNTPVRMFLSSTGYHCESYTVERFADEFGMHPLPENLKSWIGERWGNYTFIFIGAVGIGVRYIAPWVADKYTDSAVLCIDEKGKFVIPVLSGHVGGAVELATLLADGLGAVAVVTTATDLQNKFAVDVFAKKNHLYIDDRVFAKKISAAVLRGERVGFYSSFPIEGKIPAELHLCSSFEELCSLPLGIAVVDTAKIKEVKNILYLPLQIFVIGLGCRRGTAKKDLEQRLEQLLETLGISKNQIAAFTSINLKQDEAGILKLAEEYKAPFVTYSAEELQDIDAVSSESEFVKQITGVDNVCERAAQKYAPKGEVIQKKIKMDGVTFAVVKNSVKLEF
ncbi:cobalt-precorrin 5A hydrolase [Muricomes intestini]|uniref:cobalt-precorrin 5A hydrolase n=1 Tax=Muricomes intestini TaxID=1796634 RepID=UPI002FDD7F3E